MKELYGAGAFLSRNLGKAADFISAQSKAAGGHLDEMQKRASAREAARDAKQGSVDDQQDESLTDEISERFRSLSSTIRREGGELAESARRELSEALDRAEKIFRRTNNSTARSDEITKNEDREITDDPQQPHY